MTKQMRSVFEFERICKNCVHWDAPGMEDRRCNCPNVTVMLEGTLWSEPEFGCIFWECKHNVPTYLMDKDGRYVETKKCLEE